MKSATLDVTSSYVEEDEYEYLNQIHDEMETNNTSNSGAFGSNTIFDENVSANATQIATGLNANGHQAMGGVVRSVVSQGGGGGALLLVRTANTTSAINNTNNNNTSSSKVKFTSSLLSGFNHILDDDEEE